MAKQVRDPELKEQWLHIARDWEALATWIDDSEAGGGKHGRNQNEELSAVPHMAIIVAPSPALIVCPGCGLEMRLIGIEAETPQRDRYTFECEKCDRLEVRGARVK